MSENKRSFATLPMSLNPALPGSQKPWNIVGVIGDAILNFITRGRYKPNKQVTLYYFITLPNTHTRGARARTHTRAHVVTVCEDVHAD